jgi:hypothetical protein
MATKNIPWATGGGNITITYTGVGNDSPSLSAAANEGLDREQILTFKTTEGSPQKTIQRTVRQAGRREVLCVAEGDFLLAGNGGTFNVIKA